MFPVALPEFVIEAYTGRGRHRVRTFGGSGTTMLAAERTGRICRSVEIAPEYVDVAIKRFQQTTRRAGDGLIATGQSFEQVAAERCHHPRCRGEWHELAGRQDRTVADRQTAALCPQRATHSDDQVAQIAASIAEFGFTNPIARAATASSSLGHGRLAAARNWAGTGTGGRARPSEPDQRRRLVIADNRIAENAGWDDAMLRIELEALQLEGFDLDITGFDADALAELIAGDEPDNEPDRRGCARVSETPISRPGDVWIMGQHRLLCGDSTVAEPATG